MKTADELKTKLKDIEANITQVMSECEQAEIADLPDEQLRRLSALFMQIGGTGYKLLKARAHEAQVALAEKMAADTQHELAEELAAELEPPPILGPMVVVEPPPAETVIELPATTPEPEPAETGG